MNETETTRHPPWTYPLPFSQNTQLGDLELASFGEGPAVLCLHGAMGGYDQSVILAHTLGEPDYRYLALSRPGYLGTPLSRGKSPEAQADLLAALLDALCVDRAAVMAVSGGGPAALHFALRRPDRCLALVLVSTAAQPVNNRLPLSFKIMKLTARLPGFEASVRKKLEQHPERAAARAVPDETLRRLTLQNAEARHLLYELQRSTATRMRERFVGTENDVAVTRTYTYPLDRITAPTLVIQGTADPLVPFAEHGKVFIEQIPGAEGVALEGGGHPAIFTHRDEAKARTVQFLRKHLGSPT